MTFEERHRYETYEEHLEKAKTPVEALSRMIFCLENNFTKHGYRLHINMPKGYEALSSASKDLYRRAASHILAQLDSIRFSTAPRHMKYQISVRVADVEYVVNEEDSASWGDVLETVDEFVESGVFNQFTVRCKNESNQNVVVYFDKADWTSPRYRLCERICPADRDSNAYGG